MRKIIEGKIYDTETATKIAGHEYGYPGYFQSLEESLYQTKRGTFFVAGSGGGMSKHGTIQAQNELSEGRWMRLVEPNEALDFYAAHTKDYKFDHLFAGMIEEG